MIFAVDRDNTLVPWGGCVDMDLLKRLQEVGHQVGTAGGAAGEEQAAQWRSCGVEPDFTLTKADLGQLKEIYPGRGVVVVGDGPEDQMAAAQHDYEYITPQQLLEAVQALELG